MFKIILLWITEANTEASEKNRSFRVSDIKNTDTAGFYED